MSGALTYTFYNAAHISANLVMYYTLFPQYTIFPGTCFSCLLPAGITSKFSFFPGLRRTVYPASRFLILFPRLQCPTFPLFIFLYVRQLFLFPADWIIFVACGAPDLCQLKFLLPALFPGVCFQCHAIVYTAYSLSVGRFTFPTGPRVHKPVLIWNVQIHRFSGPAELI